MSQLVIKPPKLCDIQLQAPVACTLMAEGTTLAVTGLEAVGRALCHCLSPQIQDQPSLPEASSSQSQLGKCYTPQSLWPVTTWISCAGRGYATGRLLHKPWL